MFESQPFRRTFKAMGSPCEIQIFASSDDEADVIADAGVEEVERLEQLYSRYRVDSFLSRINQAAADGSAIGVDDETAHLLDYADTCFRQSDGLFDISSGILRRAWDFKRGKVATQDEIDALLPLVGWQKVTWRSPSLEFPVAGMELDFGGIVKEYAVDRVAALLLAHGIASGFVNLGGDVRVIGPRPDGDPWRVGVRHHRIGGAMASLVEIERGALASSGDYERCIVIDGVHYGHILNPRTGWPVRTLAAVSVVADLCVVAGSAATIAMLKDATGVDWLRDLGLPHRWTNVAGESGGEL